MTGIIFPSISPIAFSLGPIDIYWYGITYVVSIVLGWWYARHLVSKGNTSLTVKDIDEFVVWAAVGVIVGGRLGYVLFYHPLEYMVRPWEILYFWQPGRAFHGGLLGVIIAGIWYCWRNKLPALPLADVVCCAVPIGLFFGRIGNFINSELFGRVTEMPWGVIFPNGGPQPRHPSQLYEAVLEGALLFTLLFALDRWTSLRQKRPGMLAAVFMIGYGLARVFVEFFRQPDLHIGFLVGGTTMGQILTTPVLLVGVLLSWHVLNQKKVQS